jgi:hypothetical protein
MSTDSQSYTWLVIYITSDKWQWLLKKTLQIRSSRQPQRLVQIRESNRNPSPSANQQRALEIAKIEAFDQWVNKTEHTKEEITTKQMFDRITSKISHTLRSLWTELAQTITEKEDLQDKLEQAVKSDTHKWENILGQSQIEDPVNLITSTMKNLAPPVSIFQYYQAYRPIILKCSNLPDIKMNSQISKEQFQALWQAANSTARDLFVFMWVLKHLNIPRGVLELTTANPNFYITRFCISTLTHIQKHHEEFYTNIDNMNSLPQIEPYDLEMVREIQDMANNRSLEFLTAFDTLAQEDTSILHQATHLHQDLIRKFPDSFPQGFHRIQLNGYITRALEDRKRTLENRTISTPHARTLLYLPQYDPGSMKIPKRS